ncbi:MAG: aldo/keto reductase [archaeon]
MYTKKLIGGFEMPVLGIGTFGMGGEHDRDDSKDSLWINSLRTAIKLGYSQIDTAEVYGGGHTYELVREAIRGFRREKLFITTKVSKGHLSYDDVLSSAKNSLQKMEITYIDLLLIHAYNSNIPIENTMKAMNQLKDSGIIRNIGVCNFSINQLKEAQKFGKIVVNQMKHSLWAKGGADIETMRYCQEHDIMIVAYKLFGRGKMNTEKVELLGQLARKYHKSEAQILTNWAISKKNFVAIFQSTNKEHLKENMQSMDFIIDETDIVKLDSLFNK